MTTQYIIMNYNPDTYGQIDIREEDVVRPRNLRCCKLHSEEETCTFGEKSMAQCPTHGSCKRCLRSGPVGEYCTDCGEDYKGMYVVVIHDSHVVDSITLAQLLEHQWMKAPAQCMTLTTIDCAVGRDSTEEKGKLLMQGVYVMLSFGSAFPGYHNPEMPFLFFFFCSWCDTVVRQEVGNTCEYCDRKHCTNPDCVLFVDSRVVTTSDVCFVGEGYNERCTHNQKACSKFCFRTFDGRNATSEVYSGRNC
jgi:hypothetical protein